MAPNGLVAIQGIMVHETTTNQNVKIDGVFRVKSAITFCSQLCSV